MGKLMMGKVRDETPTAVTARSESASGSWSPPLSPSSGSSLGATVSSSSSSSSSSAPSSPPRATTLTPSPSPPASPTTLSLRVMVAQTRDPDPAVKLTGVLSARDLLLYSSDHVPTVDAILSSGLVPALLHCLECEDCNGDKVLQCEATWILSVCASGTSAQKHAVVDAAVAPLLVKQLSSRDPRVCERAVSALVRLAEDGLLMRYHVVNVGAVPAFCNLLSRSKEVRVLLAVLHGLDGLLLLETAAAAAAAGCPEEAVVARSMEECGGSEEIELLLNHKDVTIAALATRIFETYTAVIKDFKNDDHE